MQVETIQTAPSGEAAGDVRPEADAADPRQPLGRRIAGRAVRALFAAARHSPGFARRSAGFWIRGAWWCSPALRRGTLANVRRLRPGAGAAEQRRLARRVVRNFYFFVLDVAAAVGQNLEQLRRQLAGVAGYEHFDAARRQQRGLIVATAHLGSFEVGMAGLREHEAHIHVVFKRDTEPMFDRLRQELHATLGVHEAPIDEGLGLWIRLRDALVRDEVVVMQADRVMPMQKGVAMPFGEGRVMLPTGAVRLAQMTGAPILPVFAVREDDGRVRLHVEPAITVDENTGGREATDAAMRGLTEVIERYVTAHPEQWLMLHPVWLEDQAEEREAARHE